MTKGLVSLIHPRSLSDFTKKYHQNEPFVVHKDSDPSVGDLFALPFLESLETLLKSWPKDIQAHLPDVRDEVSSIDTTPKDAQKLFDNGMGLLFNEAQQLSPVLVDWLNAIRKDLGLSAQTYARCLIYATPDGKGTAPHFDQNINFVLQIHGTKIWKMAPNHSVINPMTRHTLGLPTGPEMESYQEAPMPEGMPEDAQSFELKPGSLLFVPRGYWHSTEAAGDALALNFTFTAPTWIDLFTAALRSRLMLSPEWRETADLSEEKFDMLLAMIKHDLPHWQAADILSAMEPETF